MLKIKQRKERSRVMILITPLVAVTLTLVFGSILFAFLGKDPAAAMSLLFIQPFSSIFSIGELLIKATPLILIAIGLSFGFRAGIWNIGAEGQFVMGAIAGSAVGLYFSDVTGFWLLPMMCVAGTLAGMAWGMIPAFLRVRFNANEILVSLMLSYVAILYLSAMVHGPLMARSGFNFPESELFHDAATMPNLITGTRAHIGTLAVPLVALVAWVLYRWHTLGFQIILFGQAPDAARFSGFRDHKIILASLCIPGALAGLAGTFEAAGPVGQLVDGIAAGYGFTAIIVAFLGGLHPFGIVLAGLIMAITYVGGEAVQVQMSLSANVISVFQGMLLFSLLGVEFLVGYRIRWDRQKGDAHHARASMAVSTEKGAQ